jgi:hypothetical protein
MPWPAAAGTQGRRRTRSFHASAFGVEASSSLPLIFGRLLHEQESSPRIKQTHLSLRRRVVIAQAGRDDARGGGIPGGGRSTAENADGGGWL